MQNVLTFDAFTKKIAFMAATLVLTLTMATSSVTTAQAGHRDGRVVAGVIAGAALLAIIASERRKRKRDRYRYHRHHDHGHRYHRHRRGKAYRGYRRHRGHRRDYW
jgi:hypothetical protein